ncbi:hypothetical protein VNO77_24801 [Canavalia gladiata]|uniref:Uncharacterized protein n=1 Tax=Canavalia gladiata TaxID=3824 RepID=A0AAN9QD25_CANGL
MLTYYLSYKFCCSKFRIIQYWKSLLSHSSIVAAILTLLQARKGRLLGRRRLQLSLKRGKVRREEGLTLVSEF